MKTVQNYTEFVGKRNGKFIVIEGPDASGKATQTSLLVEWLRDQGFSELSKEQEKEFLGKMPGKYPGEEDGLEKGVWKLSFPTYSQTPGGRVVQAYLDGRLGERDELEVMDIVDMYAADRKQFKQVIEEFLEAGGILVCDRYREANLIHQLVGFEDEKWDKMFSEIKAVDRDLPDSDKVFYLEISPHKAIKRMEEKDKDIHELDTDYMKESNRNGRKVAEKENWDVIDAEQSIEEVHLDIKNNIRKNLL